MYRYRDRGIAEKILDRLEAMDLDLLLMHVCGTHQDTLIRYGLEPLLRERGVDIRQGPGCPVCVTTPKEIEMAITLAEKGKILATYGDMVRVPGPRMSLAEARGRGCDVRVVYSVEDAVKLAQETGKEVVFMAIGFETTAPSTAISLLRDPPENFSILCCHRYIPPALEALLGMGELRIQGLIEPGHVSTIIGLEPYQEIAVRYGVPQVVAGFEPLDLLMAVYILSLMIERGEARVENEYKRTVRPEGNPKALQAMKAVFNPVDKEWRGFHVIRESGMALREAFEGHDAAKIYEDELRGIEDQDFETPRGCRCDQVIRGLISPKDCPLFGRLCTPKSPIGPCMVSLEGACNILYKYGDISTP